MSSYVCSYVVKKVTAHYRICVRASRQTQHETSCLEEPRGGKLLGRAENFAPPGAQPGCLEPRGGGQTLGEQSGPENLPPLGRNRAAWRPGGGVNFWCQKILPPPWGATGDL